MSIDIIIPRQTASSQSMAVEQFDNNSNIPPAVASEQRMEINWGGDKQRPHLGRQRQHGIYRIWLRDDRNKKIELSSNYETRKHEEV